MKGRVDTSFLCPVNLEALRLQGSISSTDFKYFKIGVKACVDRPDCRTRENFPDVGINLVMLKAQPDIFKRNRGEVIDYITEVNKRYLIDPVTSQTENLYFQESEVLLKD